MDLNIYISHVETCYKKLTMAVVIAMAIVMSSSVVQSSNLFPDNEFSKVKSGDIILRKYNDFVSNLIVDCMSEKSRFSHLGIIYVESGKASIVHIIGDGMHNSIRKDSIEAFVYDPYVKDVKIVRLKGNYNDLIIKYALEYYEKKVNFDYNFNIFDDSKLYCSELAYHVFRKIGQEHLIKFKTVYGKSLILFDSFLDDNFFEKIYSKKLPGSKI